AGGQLLGLRCTRLDDFPDAVPQTGDHRSTGAGVEDLPPVGEIEADAVAALHVRIRQIEEAREDARLGRRDGHRFSLATRSRNVSSRRCEAVRAEPARSYVSV